MERLWYYADGVYIGSEPAQRGERADWFDAPDRADAIVLATAVEVFDPSVPTTDENDGIVLMPGPDARYVSRTVADEIRAAGFDAA